MMRIGVVTRVLLAALVWSAAMTASAGAGCFTVNAVPSAVFVSYSPLGASDTIQDFQIQVHNNSCGANAPVTIGLANTPLDAAGLPAGSRVVLSYDAEVYGPAGTLVLSSNTDQFVSAAYGTFNEGQTVSQTWHVRIPAHSTIAPGQSDFSIFVAADVGGAVQYAETAVHVNSAPVLQLAFSGGGTALTMDFGELSTGQTQSVTVNAWANIPFQVIWNSDNAGVLKNLGAAGWSIPYTAALNGHSMSNGGAPYTDTTPDNVHVTFASLPLTVTIGDTANRRAGTYRDIITITIQAAP